MKRFMMQATVATVLALVALGANRYNTPRSIVHVVTILWKENSTPEQQRASLEGVKKMAAEIPGIKNVWIKPIKVQGSAREGKDGKPGRPYESAFVIEFADQAAADRYVDHPAHIEWNNTSRAFPGERTSHPITQ